MDGGVIFGLVVVVLIGLFGFYLWIHSQAKRTDETVVPISASRVADAVSQSFGPLWKDWEGPAQINKKRRGWVAAYGKGHLGGSGPVVSVQIEPASNGGTQVSVWMSAWITDHGVPLLSGTAYRQKRKILKRVEAAAAQQGATTL
ncbi:hypothetical protein [Nocardia higoensis]|uniref:hypothetical protein n=1 Tax=Nocardia higoensis TaxID=228599 RepID=UPI00031A1387|nr:hypothetical protein [Nocardia higoensis]